MAITFSRQTTSVRASTSQYWENLVRVVVLVLDSKTSKLSITGEPEQPDDDGSKNLKKQTLILSAKQQHSTCIALCGIFLSRPLYDQDVKLPINATFYGGREHDGFSFLFFKINTALKNSTAETFADI